MHLTLVMQSVWDLLLTQSSGVHMDGGASKWTLVSYAKRSFGDVK